MRRNLARVWMAAAVVGVAAGGLVAGDGSDGGIASYTRVRTDEDGVMTLEIRTRTLVPIDAAGPRIHLVGAVHVADRSFYRETQRTLDRHDVVLFEGVRPAGAGKIDASLDDAGKAAATRQRMRFVKLLVEQFHEKNGRFPTDFDDLARNGPRRFRSILEGAARDAWGKAIALELTPVAATEDKPATEFVRLTSLGADGQAGGDGANADIAVKTRRFAPDRGPRTPRKASNVQAELAKALGLSFQLDEIDSGKPNWRSCDMNMDELQKRLDQAGPNAGALLKVLDGNSFLGQVASFALRLLSSSPQMSATMKMMVVEALAHADDIMGARPEKTAASGPAEDGPFASIAGMAKVLIDDRNKVVVRDLKKIIENERSVRDVAVFYGAGHMSDLESRIMTELRYKPDADAWTAAIRADPKDAGMTADEARNMRRTLRRMLERRGAMGKSLLVIE